MLRQCSKTLRSKIEGRKDYEQIHNDPFKLLKTIREHAIAFDERKYGPTTILETLRSLVNIRQKESEQLVDYTLRFKHTREVLKEQIDRIRACNGASVSGRRRSQQIWFNDSKPKQPVQSKKRPISKNNSRCAPAVTIKDKTETKIPELSFAQIEGKYYCCGKGGHKSPECRDKKRIPKDQWAINKVHVEEKPKEVKSCAQWSFLQKSNHNGMRTRILLDSQSSVDLFCNPNLVSNIRPSKEKLNLVMRQQADVANYGTVWFNDKAMTNVFSLASMEKRYPVTYDSSSESAFIVHRAGDPVRFELAEDNLYSIDTAVQLVQTVNNQAKNFTPRQIKRAKAAQTLRQVLGYPTVRDMQAILKSNDDVDLALRQNYPEETYPSPRQQCKHSKGASRSPAGC